MADGIQDNAAGTAAFDALVQKPRALLTLKERKLMASRRRLSDALFALKNAQRAGTDAVARIAAAEAAVTQASQDCDADLKEVGNQQ